MSDAQRWVGGVLFIAVLVIVNTAVLVVLWAWFMTPLGLPQIGFAWALGLMCVAEMFTSTPPPVPEEHSLQHIVNLLCKPAMALIFGFAAKQFM